MSRFGSLPGDQVSVGGCWLVIGELRREMRGGRRSPDAARDVYVMVSGEEIARREVLIDDEYVRHLASGDFLGEVAALDGGSGFGYVRTATVVASCDLRPGVLGRARLGALISACPVLGDRIRAAARERMRGL